MTQQLNDVRANGAEAVSAKLLGLAGLLFCPTAVSSAMLYWPLSWDRRVSPLRCGGDADAFVGKVPPLFVPAMV